MVLCITGGMDAFLCAHLSQMCLNYYLHLSQVCPSLHTVSQSGKVLVMTAKCYL